MGRQVTAHFANPFSPKVMPCAVCLGMRVVYRADYSARPCPNCGCSCGPRSSKEKAGGAQAPSCDNDEKFRRLKADAYFANSGRPTITEKDLTEKERKHMDAWRFQFPKYSILTFLTWIEGLRYTDEPMKQDRDFQRAVFTAIGAWHEHRDAAEEARK